ncbi:MAG: hypothetical protein U0V73_02365 [Acidimicrobiia bacterium]
MNDWSAEAADTVERVVVIVRDKTVVPVQAVTKAVVYGLVAATLAAIAMVLLSTALFRFVAAYLPFGGIWTVHLIVGGIFVLAGLFAWSRREA